MIKKCQHCGAKFEAKQSYINYGREPKWCHRRCFGLSRRKNRTVAERKELKRLYDIEYRNKNRARLLLEKKEWYRAAKERVKARMKLIRKTPAYKRKMKAYLAEYWKRPGLKAEKKDYDRKFRAKKKFGAFWEAHYLTMLIKDEVRSRMSAYEIRLQNRTLNKALMRSRNGQVKRSYT